MWAFLNDQFVAEEKAMLNVADLSIQRGYGVFDFFKVLDFVPVFLKDHLDRFYYSAEQMRLEVGYSKDQLRKIIFELPEDIHRMDTSYREPILSSQFARLLHRQISK